MKFLKFLVYRTKDNGGEFIVATRFQADAEKVLSNWHSGYILDAAGNKVVVKN